MPSDVSGFRNAIERATLERATRVFGEEAQMGKTQEECRELDDAIYDYAVGEADEDAVIDEIADVIVMAEQMADVFGRDAVTERVEFKMNRLQNRLDRAEGEQEEIVDAE